jgi:tRNA (mo5U34)-methyltransferase
MSIHPGLANRKCYHQYEVSPGLFTPGTFLKIDPRLCLDELGVPKDLSGFRALDIGAWDGPLTFELERRGASVTALDIQDPDVTVFNAVKAIRRSEARYVRGSVYDACPDTLGRFDVVLFAGVYYHLKNPVLAFQRIRKLLNDGGSLFVEGGCASDYLGRRVAAALGMRKSRVAAVTAMLDQLPISYFDTQQDIYRDWSNWWFPTTRCLEAVLLDSGFRKIRLALKENAFYGYSHRRLMGQAEADPEKADPAAQKHEHWVAGPGAFQAARPLEGHTYGLPQWLVARLRKARAIARRFLR